MSNLWYIIPAREGSKGFPKKNQFLFDHTAKKIPPEQKKRVIVTTDDETIKEKARKYGFVVYHRSKELSMDDTSIFDVMKDVIDNCPFIEKNDDIVLLYLVYPERTYDEIEKIYKFYKTHKAQSLLCSVPVKTHPYMCFHKMEKYRGSCVIEHDFYRRQDYPECFQISHYVCIFKKSELKKMQANLYNKDTFFYSIGETIDVDRIEDLNLFNKVGEKTINVN